MERFQFQREIRLNPYIRRNFSRPRDHLIPQVSFVNTPKEMLDSLTKLFEGKNINQKNYRNFVILEEIDLDQYFSKKIIRARGR